MNAGTREALARAAAARLDGAACREQGELWAAQEAAHKSAEGQPAAAAAAAPLLALCARCPVVPLCAQWAQVDAYTGVAAGQAWVDGVAKPAQVRRRSSGAPADPQSMDRAQQAS